MSDSGSYINSSNASSNDSISNDSKSNDEIKVKPKKITPQMRYYEKNQDKLRTYYRNKMREKYNYKPRQRMSDEERLERTRQANREYYARNKDTINEKNKLRNQAARNKNK